MELKFAERRAGHYPLFRVQSTIPCVVHNHPPSPNSAPQTPHDLRTLCTPDPVNPLHFLLF